MEYLLIGLYHRDTKWKITQYVRANYEEKARMLKFVVSNYTLKGISLYPTYKKPFDIIAKGLSCTSWLLG